MSKTTGPYILGYQREKNLLVDTGIVALYISAKDKPLTGANGQSPLAAPPEVN